MNLEKFLEYWGKTKKYPLPIRIPIIFFICMLGAWALIGDADKKEIQKQLYVWLSLNVHTQVWLCILVVICAISLPIIVRYFWLQNTKLPPVSDDERKIMVSFALADTDNQTFEQIMRYPGFVIDFRLDVEVKQAIGMLINRGHINEVSGCYMLTSSGLKHVDEFVKVQRHRTN